MSKVTIAGNSYVLTSAISLEDLETVKKYRPSALTAIDPETKETLFKIGTGSTGASGASSVSDYGINFGGVTNDEKKLATATLPIPADVEDAKSYVLDKAGLAIANLNKIEEGITAALKDIRAERDKVAGSINVSV